ncbi:MAG: hypothetical protein K2X76_16470, partial [Sphingomonas sp.]|nr:hypothetical protein [Sphingomonas sp.]
SPAPDPRDQEIASLREQIAARDRVIKERDAALVAGEKRHADELRRTADEARDAGRAAAEQDDAARIAALTQGLAAARDGVAERLAWIERLAPELARRALARLIGQGAAEPFVALVRTQVAALGDAVTTVFVAPDDLPPLTETLPGVAVDPTLAPGTARIECRLGTLELTLERQAAPLADLLERLARP